jgi:hypothetical protein
MAMALLAFLAARSRFEAIDRARDVLLMPIDIGEMRALSDDDQAVLMRLNAELATAYAMVQETERELTPEVRAQVREAGLRV